MEVCWTCSPDAHGAMNRLLTKRQRLPTAAGTLLSRFYKTFAPSAKTASRPFPKPETGKFAVKVINHYGDEVLKVYET